MVGCHGLTVFGKPCLRDYSTTIITPHTTNHLPTHLKIQPPLSHNQNPKLLEKEINQRTKSNTP